MRKGLLFISMVAFICNLCFVLSVVARHVHQFEQLPQFAKGTIGVLGFLSVFLNIFVTVAVLVALAFRKGAMKVWLVMANLILLVFQVIASYFGL